MPAAYVPPGCPRRSFGSKIPTPMSATRDQIDLVNPDSYVDHVPFEWFDRLRREEPVSWHPEPAGNAGFWAVTRYDDLTAVHMDWQTYSSEIGAVALEELDDVQNVYANFEVSDALMQKMST